MPDKVGNETSKYFASGPWALPIVCGYPIFWIVLTLNGFGYYLEWKALKVFADYKVLICKREEIHITSVPGIWQLGC